MDEMVEQLILGNPNATAFNGAQLLNGKVGLALYTNGVDQWVDLGNQRHSCAGNFHRCNSGFVMVMWMKAHSDGFVLSSGGQHADSMGVALKLQQTILRARFRQELVFWALRGTFGVSFEVWYHVAMTWDAATGGKCYVNGVLDAQGDIATSQLSNREGNTYAKFILASGNIDPPYQAAGVAIDELRIWDVAANETLMWQIYVRDVLYSTYWARDELVRIVKKTLSIHLLQ